MSRWNDAIHSIALEMNEGEDVSRRISYLADRFNMDVHSTTIAVEERAELLREEPVVLPAAPQPEMLAA